MMLFKDCYIEIIMKKYEFGVFLCGGGNRVLFSDGVLKVLLKEGIAPDYWVSKSASSGIMFGHLLNCSDWLLDHFWKRCQKNQKNFYWFKKEHFPHDEMLEGSMREMFRVHGLPKNKRYSIIASDAGSRFSRLKAVASFFLMILSNLGVSTKNLRKFLGINEYLFKSSENYSKEELISIIMGSSTIYPFIGLHFLRGRLLLESEMLKKDYPRYLEKCKKGIIIYNRRGGISHIEGNILHFYSSVEIPNTTIDYSFKSKIREIRKIGEAEAKKQLSLVRKFLNKPN